MNKIYLKLFTVALFCFIISCSSDSDEDSSTFIDIPDPIFKAYCLSNLDRNKDGNISVSEVGKIKELDISGNKIKSLEGIQCFISLAKLECAGNELTEIDLSKNKNLIYLDCSYNIPLATLDVSHNLKLKHLHCIYTAISTLDVSKNLDLIELYCFLTQNLTEVWMSKDQNIPDFGTNDYTEVKRK